MGKERSTLFLFPITNACAGCQRKQNGSLFRGFWYRGRAVYGLTWPQTGPQWCTGPGWKVGTINRHGRAINITPSKYGHGRAINRPLLISFLSFFDQELFSFWRGGGDFGPLKDPGINGTELPNPLANGLVQRKKAKKKRQQRTKMTFRGKSYRDVIAFLCPNFKPLQSTKDETPQIMYNCRLRC